MSTSDLARMFPFDTPGVRIENPGMHSKSLQEILTSAIRLADIHSFAEVPLRGNANWRLASRSAIQTVNAMLAAVAVKCHLAAPAEEIDMVLDSSNQLIYRCLHTPPHEWKLSGQPRR